MQMTFHQLRIQQMKKYLRILVLLIELVLSTALTSFS
jgi:hypothetical protein